MFHLNKTLREDKSILLFAQLKDICESKTQHLNIIQLMVSPVVVIKAIPMLYYTRMMDVELR